MRLFEVDLGAARDVLAVLQGVANKQGQSAELPFPVVLNILKSFALGINTPDALRSLKDKVDPAGDVIKDILDDGTVVLNTKTASQIKQAPIQKAVGPSVEKMAAQGSKKLAPEI